jgi:hypothetical protein
MFAMAGALRELTLTQEDERSLVGATIVMGWGNSLGYGLGAFLGKRGLEPKPDANLLPFMLFVLAIGGLTRVLQLTYRGAQDRIAAKPQ